MSDLNLQNATIQIRKCDMQVCKMQSVKMQKWLLEPAEALDPSQISNPAPPDLNLRKRFSTVSFEEGLRFSIEKFLHIKRGHHPNRVEPLMSRKLPKNKRKEKNNNFIKKRKNNICIWNRVATAVGGPLRLELAQWLVTILVKATGTRGPFYHVIISSVWLT